MGREVLRLRRAHLGRIDDGEDVPGLDRLPEVDAGFSEEARDSRGNLGVAVGVVGRLGVRGQLVGVLVLGHRSRLEADVSGEVRRSEADHGQELAEPWLPVRPVGSPNVGTPAVVDQVAPTPADSPDFSLALGAEVLRAGRASGTS